MGVTEYKIDDLWELASELKATYSPSPGDAYTVAAAGKKEDTNGNDVTLLVGGDDDRDTSAYPRLSVSDECSDAQSEPRSEQAGVERTA